MKTFLFFILLFSIRESIAQQPYECKIQNITYVSPTVLEFDIYIKNTGTSTLLFNSFQGGIDFNYVGMAGTGTITGAFVAGSNSLPAPQNAPNWNINATSKQIRMLAAIVTASTSAAPITSTPLMLGKFRMTNTVPFTACATPNFSWSFVTAANKTKTAITAWVGTATSPVSITDPAHAAATFANGGGPQHYVASNPAVTCCPTAATYVGTDPICYAGTGSAVVTITGAAASTAGTYTVDGGSVLSFSANPFTITGLTTGSHNIQITPATCTAIPLTVITGGPTSPLTNTTNATACNTYTWAVNGLTYTQSGTYSGTTTNGSGCTVNETLNLTINTGTTTTTNACGTYTWASNNQTYTTSGTYTNGCDILNLTITAANSTSATACDSYTWAVNNQIYTTSGTYTSGCDILNLTINASTTSTTNATACDTYTWIENGLTYTTSGTYTANSTNAAGCPHVATLNLTINSSSTSITNATACDTYTWSANGLTYTTSGTYTATSTNASGCPHVATLNLTINASTTSTTNATACDSYQWSVNGQTYSTGGTYTATTTNAAGCPEVATLNLTINTSTSSSSSATACDSYTWTASGMTYTTSGTYTNTSTNAAGCPNLDTLNLTINTSSSSTTTATACDSYIWSADGLTYTNSGTYTATSTNASGCPHTATLNLTINLSTSSNTAATACNSYTWSVNGLTYTQSGIYTNTSTNASGCPHTDTLTLTISSGTNNTTTASACDTYTWAVNGLTYTQSGTYTSVTGCAVETLVLTITPSSSNSTTVSACDTYTWAVNGLTYTQSGTYTNVSNCVTQILNLTINSSSAQTQTQSACGSYTWPVNGLTYTQSGTYSATVNCVTTTLNLTVTPSTSNTTTATACGTYTWSVNGQTYTQSGTYTSVSGCNTEILVLTVNSTQGTTTTASGCGSYTWPLNGQSYTASGTYTFVTGCATNTLNLTITASAVVSNLQAVNITGISAVGTWSLVSGIGWYEARWRPVGSLTWTSGTTNGSQKNIINLLPNTTYELQVRGFCSLNNAGLWSPSVNFTTNIVCDVPVNVIGVSTVGNQATISWTNVPGAGFYNLRYKIASGGAWVLVSNVTNPKQLNNLVPNTTYSVQVQSGCMGGNALSPWSAVGTFTTAPPCSEPSGLTATNITMTAAKLNWQVPTGATYYTVRYRKVGNTNWNTGSSTTPTKNINGLSAGQQYEWQIRTSCGNAVSGWSLLSTFTTNIVKTNDEEPTDVLAVSSDVNIFPNPTHDELNIEFSVTEYTQTIIKVVDMSGRTVKQVQLNAEAGKNLTSISLGDLANGLYSLQIIGNDRLLQVSRINKN